MLYAIIVAFFLLLILIILLCNINKTDKFDDINNTVIINFFTKDLCEEWKNHIYTLKKFNLDKYVVVFPLDYDALECVKSENIKYNTKLINNINISQGSFGDDNFKKIVYYKFLAIKHFIDLNYNVFYLDTDTIVFGNIIEDIKTYPENIDLYAQEDEGTICSGCMLMIPTENMKKLINKSIEYYDQDTRNKNFMDQDIINYYKNIINYYLLPWEKYASGKQYFEKNSKYFENNKPLFLHNNWIKGLEAKINRFKQHGLWYI